MERRNFLRSTLLGSTGLALAPTLLSSCKPGHDPLRDIGIITNVVGTHVREDHRATLVKLAEMGYRYLEFGSGWDEDPEVLGAFLKQIGLKPLVGGSSIQGLKGDGLKQTIDTCLAYEKPYLVCYWPWMDDGWNPKMDYIKGLVEDLNEIGHVCRTAGLQFVYHNHDQEFLELDGRVIYDFILENTDPELMNMQIDLYWAHKGGGDIREYFDRYPGRFPLVHVKDSYDQESRESFACVGQGIIDFEDLLSYREVAGFRHLIVEHDHPAPEQELECARTSIEHLKSLDY